MPMLAKLPWHRGGALEVAEGRAVDSDTASITRAFAGVAESGTIIQLSGPDNPTTLNFLPEAHIVVLEAASICLPATKRPGPSSASRLARASCRAPST